MGLLSIIRKQKLKDLEIRVLVLGLDNSGKTTIVRRIMGEDTTQVAPTMGFHIHTFEYGGYSINAWDIGGQTTLRNFWGNYFDKSDVVMWVVDGTSLERLQESYRELRDKVVAQDQMAGTFFCVLINKMDAVPATERAHVKARVVATLRLEEEIPPDRYMVENVSGREGHGLGGAMDWVVKKWNGD